jgi:hypothetical protein
MCVLVSAYVSVCVCVCVCVCCARSAWRVACVCPRAYVPSRVPACPRACLRALARACAPARDCVSMRVCEYV